MKKIGMMVLFSLFLLAMPVPAWGASTELAPYLEDLDMEQIDAAAEDAVEDVTFSELVEDVLTGDFSFSMEDLWEKLGEVAFGELRTQTGLIMQLIAVSILAAVLRQVSGSFCGREVGEMGFYVCYMVLIVVIITTFYDITAMVVERVEQTADIFGAMLPVFLALAASSGNLTQTALMGPTMMGGCTLIVLILKSVVVPVLLAAVALELVDRLSEQPLTARFAALLRQGVSWGLKGLAGGFMLLLSLQKIGGGAVNGLAVRTAKIAVNAVPVVGDVMGGAVDTAAAVAGTIRSGTLAAAVIFLLLLCIPLVIKLVAMTLIFKLTAAAVESVCEARLVECIGIAGDYTALLLGVVFLVEVMFLFSSVLLLGVL